MNIQPRSAGADSMAELDELLSQLGDVPGPTPEQVAALDRALEPYLGVISVVDPSNGAHQSSEGAAASIDGASQGAAASPTGLVSGKLLGVLGSVVVVGAVLWGAAELREPNVQPAAHLSGGAARHSSLVARHDNDLAPASGSLAESELEEQAEAVHVNTPAERAVENAVVPRTSAGSGGRDGKRTTRVVPKPSVPSASSGRSPSVSSDDWALELERLERAEAALKSRRVDAALVLLHDGDFTTLHLNARALEAAALCAGDATQRQRGAALARQLAQSERSALLVRRLKDCMARH